MSRHEIDPQEMETVRRLLKRIGRKNPVRQSAEVFLEGGEVPPQTTELLLKTLKTPKPYFWRRQTVAAWILGYKEWQPEDREIAEKRLIKMVDLWALHNAGYRILRTLGWGGALCAALFLSLFAQSHPKADWVLFAMVFGGLFLTTFFALCLWPVFALVENGKLTRIRMAAMSALGRLCSVEGLPALTRACIDGPESNSFVLVRNSRKMRSAALQAMERILPCVTEYDYARLAANIPMLCRVLESLAIRARQEPQLSERVALQILSALGKVGDGRAAVIVERVAQKATAETVRKAAWDILPLLQDRKRQENAANTLLRGASPNMEAQETLLRAATAGDLTDPKQLLRPNIPSVSQVILEPQLTEPRILQSQAMETATIDDPALAYETLASEAPVQQAAGQS